MAAELIFNWLQLLDAAELCVCVHDGIGDNELKPLGLDIERGCAVCVCGSDTRRTIDNAVIWHLHRFLTLIDFILSVRLS